MPLQIYNNRDLSTNTLEECSRALRDGGVVIFPTDTSYMIGCDALCTKALERVAQFKGIALKQAHFSILCADLSQASNYVRISNEAFKLIKEHTPGPFTFILPTGASLPKIYKGRKAVGIRIPDHAALLRIIEYYGVPLTGFSLPLPYPNADEAYQYHPELIAEAWGDRVDMIVVGEEASLELSTVVDCTSPEGFEVIREGAGRLSFL